MSGSGTATFTDCTISGNSAVFGGGLDGAATFTDCTISSNSAQYGGALWGEILTDTIVAGNTGHLGAPSDIGGNASVVTGTYNLIGTGGSGGITGGSNGNIVLNSLSNLDLGPLANHGGSTETMALLPGSAAIQAGIEADYPGTTKPVTTDQRGDLLDSPPDIGADQNPTLNVTNATTGEDVQTTSGLVITPTAADVTTVTSFQITNIAGGSLFLNDGVTPVTNGEFISVAQGAAGLKFTPTTGSLATGSFTAEESTTGDTSGLIPASAATATIAVQAPTPTVTNATTGEDAQTMSGLVITPGSVDTSLITVFQVTGITGGTLFLNDGVTPITNGVFITLVQGAAGLKFTPTAGSLATGSFTVQDAIAADTTGLLGVTATATITVQAPTPTVTNATTGENVQSSSGLVITPGSVDTSLITDFQITGITGGSLFLNDGVTPVTNGTFITAAQGAAGLKFTPTAGSLATGSFTVQDAFAANTAGLLGTTATATVTVLAPTFENVPTLLHGVETVGWSALGYNPATITVDITAYQAGKPSRLPPISP